MYTNLSSNIWRLMERNNIFSNVFSLGFNPKVTYKNKQVIVYINVPMAIIQYKTPTEVTI